MRAHCPVLFVGFDSLIAGPFFLCQPFTQHARTQSIRIVAVDLFFFLFILKIEKGKKIERARPTNADRTFSQRETERRRPVVAAGLSTKFLSI